MPDIYEYIGEANIPTSSFELSHEVIGNCDLGECIPILLQECVPGDNFEIGSQIAIRTTPLTAPAFIQLNALVNYFFIPNRILWEEWEDFITGGKDGTANPAYPKWTPQIEQVSGAPAFTTRKYTIWDYLGLPVNNWCQGVEPSILPLYAMNMIYNEWFRDENVEDERLLTDNSIYRRAWEKDYFTSCLPFQQRGIAPSIPLTGMGYADFSKGFEGNATFNAKALDTANFLKITNTVNPQNNTNIAIIAQKDTGQPNSQQARETFKEWLNSNEINLDNIATFNVTDLRNITALQRVMERNARGGYRYREWIQAHFNVTMPDARAQIPELIFSGIVKILVDEISQTFQSNDSTPLGTWAGQASGVGINEKSSYYCQEYGYIIGIMSIMPKPLYGSQGVPRWLRRYSRLEQFMVEFVNLSEQEVDNAELCVDPADNNPGGKNQGSEEKNKKIFGYQGRYNEMRTRQGYICADMRDTLTEWHLARIFDQQPALNQQFLDCNPSKRIFNAQKKDDKNIIYYVFNEIIATRKLPIEPEPGMLDHI